MFGTLVDYWFLTGDQSYNNITMQAMLHQVGENEDFMPENQTRTLGNDDQGFWAMAAMSAAENNFPNPPADQPQWLALAQAAFNEYATRWDTETCGGGLRWQIFTFNNGYNYKNSISNGCFFNIAARLARYTGNQTYANWAARIWDWQVSVDLITPQGHVYDGASVAGSDNCTKHDMVQWSYNAGIFMHGAAVMYNITGGSALWQQRLESIIAETTAIFFNNSVMIEQACEDIRLCNIDQQSFKGYLTRWMAGTTVMAPFTAPNLVPLLRASAAAAAKACSGSPATGFNGHPGTACGFSWVAPEGFDGLVGVGEQMNALSAVMYTLAGRAPAPFTADNGGTSVGNPEAGMEPPAILSAAVTRPISAGERVAAGFFTTAVILSVIGGSVFVLKD